MRKAIFTFILVVATLLPNLNAQQIESCTGNNQKSMQSIEKSVIFNVAGMNLAKYDWSNPDVNCHINNTIKFQKKAQTSKWIGWTGALTGASLMLVGFAGGSGPYSEDHSTVGYLGAALTGGGIYFVIDSKKSKRKSNFHLGQVSNYYQQKKLF